MIFADRTEAGRFLAAQADAIRRPSGRAGAGLAARRRARRLRGGAGPCTPRSTSSWSASWACRATRSWRWGPSPPAACACSTRTWSGAAHPDETSSRPSPRRSSGSWSGASGSTAATGRRPTCAAAPSSWSTTAWRPARPCGPRSPPCASRGPARIVVAVPVGAAETCAEFQEEADEVVCARTPEPFYAGRRPPAPGRPARRPRRDHGRPPVRPAAADPGGRPALGRGGRAAARAPPRRRFVGQVAWALAYPPHLLRGDLAAAATTLDLVAGRRLVSTAGIFYGQS